MPCPLQALSITYPNRSHTGSDIEPRTRPIHSHATTRTRCIYLKILHSMCSRPSMVASSAIMSSTRAFCVCSGPKHMHVSHMAYRAIATLQTQYQSHLQELYGNAHTLRSSLLASSAA